MNPTETDDTEDLNKILAELEKDTPEEESKDSTKKPKNDDKKEYDEYYESPDTKDGSEPAEDMFFD